MCAGGAKGLVKGVFERCWCKHCKARSKQQNKSRERSQHNNKKCRELDVNPHYVRQSVNTRAFRQEDASKHAARAGRDTFHLVGR